MSTIRKKRNQYDEAFKQKAVRILIDSGKPVTKIAHQLGIEQSNLHRWYKRYESDLKTKPPTKYTSETQSAEISALKKEIAAIRDTVEVLRSIILKTLGEKHSFR